MEAAGSRFVVAVVGAGPAGLYAAEALAAQTEVEVDIAVLDRLPVPFGLVRYGVAPDHHSIRSIRRTLERTLERGGVRLYGNVSVGDDLPLDDLRGAVDAVIYAYGSGADRRLGIEGEDLDGSIAAPEFVAWYCGHPDGHPDPAAPEPAAGLLATTRQAVVIGVGNVALDVARVLLKTADQLASTDMATDVLDSLRLSQVTDVHVLGRRGPVYTTFTTKELREIGQLDGVDVVVDAADLQLDESSRLVADLDKVAARNLAVFQEWANRSPTGAPKRVHFHFWTRPTRLLGRERVEAVQVERTGLDANGAVTGLGAETAIPAQLVIRSIGYRGTQVPGVPFDASTGRVPHAEGRVIRNGAFSADEYVTGWIKRGPTGVIGTNKSDAVETVTALITDIADGKIVAMHSIDELDRLLTDRGLSPLDVSAWRRVDAAEIALGRSLGRDRSTLAHKVDLMAAALDRSTESSDA